jgi:hypothetical protein
MQVKDVPGARTLVQAVDILGQDANGFKVVVHLRDHTVPAVGRGVAGGLFQLQKIVPGDLRPDPEHRARKRLLDRQSVRGIFLSPVKSVTSAVCGKTRVGGDAGSGDEK